MLVEIRFITESSCRPGHPVPAGCLALPIETITVDMLTSNDVHLYFVKLFTDMGYNFLGASA